MSDKTRGAVIPMTRSGHCAWPSTSDPESSHAMCRHEGCTCTCHGDATATPTLRRGQIVVVDGEEYLYLSTTANGKHLVSDPDTGDRRFLPATAIGAAA